MGGAKDWEEQLGKTHSPENTCTTATAACGDSARLMVGTDWRGRVSIQHFACWAALPCRLLLQWLVCPCQARVALHQVSALY